MTTPEIEAMVANAQCDAGDVVTGWVIQSDEVRNILTTLTAKHQEDIEKAVAKELEEVLNCLPLRSDWDDDVKVTFKMGIDVVRDLLIERIQALTPTKTDKQEDLSVNK